MIITNIANSKDIRISDGMIVEIGDNLKDKEIYDAKGMEIFPLAVDLNVKNSESISKLNTKALQGGVGTILMIPQHKPIYNKLQLAYNLTKEKDITLLVAIEAIHDNKLTDIHILIDKGASALFVNSDEDMNLIKRVFQYAQMLRVPIFVNANNTTLVGNGQMNSSKNAYLLGLEGIDNYVESIEVAKILEFSQYFDVRVIFQSITTKESLSLLQKRDRDKIFVDVCIDNLLYTDDEIGEFNTFFKTFPPLRSQEDRLALLEAVANNQIDFISSNHIATSDENKDVAFEVAQFGIPKLDKFAQLAYSLDIDRDIITRLISTNPAKLFALNEGEIKVGYKAKLMLMDDNGHIHHTFMG
ncbi:MAG: dihydroorotase [Epsilonproteobacteria bacterium]|nr:dihydroorotase [Campylobacterota bacterium]